MTAHHKAKFCYFSVCDNRYIPHFLAMMTSLAEVDKQTPLFLVQTDITRKNARMIENHARSIGINLTILGNPGIDLSVFAKCGDYPEAVWLKYHIEELFPKQFEKILYIDPDTIITGELKSVFKIDMKSKPLASVIDMMDENDGFKSNLGIPEQGRYFNTGVILYDRRKFRELQIGKKSAEYAMRNPGKITYIDQCGFNAAAWDQFLEIGREWNLMVGFHQGQLAKTSIVHFCALKPWENKGVPGLELYAHFRNKTPMPLEMNNNESAGFLEPVATFLAGLKARLHAAVSNRKTYQVELVRVRNRKLLREYWKSRYHGSD